VLAILVLIFAQRLAIRESRFRDPAGDSCPSGQDVKSLPPRSGSAFRLPHPRGDAVCDPPIKGVAGTMDIDSGIERWGC
jgi:hypothetical protein